MSIKRLDIDDRRWAAFVSAAPDALPYHQPAWASLLAECYGYEPFVLAETSEDGRIAAGLPVLRVKIPLRPAKWISLPFTDVCPVLSVTDSARDSLTGALDAHRQAAGIARWEVRTALSLESSQVVPQGTWHELTLSGDPNELFGRFKSTVKRAIRKAEKSGLSVHPAERQKDLTDLFYRLHVDTRRRLGVPVQPKRFFRLFWEMIVEAGLGRCLLVSTKGRPVAAAVFITANGKTTYKYGASDQEHWQLRPNNLLFWHAIKHACEQGGRSFDFGKTEVGNEGLRTFKLGWGATEREIAYTTLGAAAAPATAAATHESPRVLSTLIQRSPAWLCRAIGEALYRYAA